MKYPAFVGWRWKGGWIFRVFGWGLACTTAPPMSWETEPDAESPKVWRFFRMWGLGGETLQARIEVSYNRVS